MALQVFKVNANAYRTESLVQDGMETWITFFTGDLTWVATLTQRINGYTRYITLPKRIHSEQEAIDLTKTILGVNIKHEGG